MYIVHVPTLHLIAPTGPTIEANIIAQIPLLFRHHVFKLWFFTPLSRGLWLWLSLGLVIEIAGMRLKAGIYLVSVFSATVI